jgi:hypothetical protein
MKKLLLAFIAIAPLMATADSPLTSTSFSEAYLDIKIVKYAKETGTLDKKVAKYLLKDSNPLDVKLAAINAIGWSTAGQDNADLFRGFITRKYTADQLELQVEALTAGEAICLGYLVAMDDYFNPGNAMAYVDAALAKDSTSYSLHMIAALIKAQVAFDTDWCEVYELAYAVEENPFLARDMRQTASIIIMDYMSLYSGECE